MEVGDVASRFSSFFFSFSLCSLAALLTRDLIVTPSHSPKVKFRLTVLFPMAILANSKQQLGFWGCYSEKMCPSMSCVELLCT